MTAQDLFEYWNKLSGPLPKALKLTSKRESLAKRELKKYPEGEHWAQVLAKWYASDFCTKQWKPGFDDFLNENKRIATLEGRYDNREPSYMSIAEILKREL